MLTTLLSPSYINDLERAIWMRRSIRRFQQEPFRHVIAVPRRDLDAFAAAFRDDPNVELVTQEEVVANYFYPKPIFNLVKRVAPSQLWRLQGMDGISGRAGWVIQQIVKLGCTKWINDGAVAIVDSDLIFLKPFSSTDLDICDSTRTLVRITPKDESSRHRAHVNNARRILGLPPGPSEQHYMGYPTVWYVDWVLELQKFLAALDLHGDWQRPLFKAGHISEYTIYGIFVEEHLKCSTLRPCTRPFHHIVFDAPSFKGLREQQSNLQLLRENFLTLVVQSNMGLPVSDYEEVLSALIS